jgi:hypothetical protein
VSESSSPTTHPRLDDDGGGELLGGELLAEVAVFVARALAAL